METSQQMEKRVLSTWPHKDAPETWVSHVCELLSEPDISHIFIDPTIKGGGELSFRWDGLILTGPRFSTDQYSALVDAVQSRLDLTNAHSSQSHEGILWQDGKAFKCGVLSTHKGASITLKVHSTLSVPRKPQNLNDWPPHALKVVEKMRSHPNGLMVFCHRGYSTQTGAMFQVLGVMQEELKDGTRFGCVSESLDTLSLRDGIVSVRVTTARESWEQALSSLMAQDIDVCAMAGRNQEETTAQAVLMALEDRCVLVNVSLPSVTDTLLWLLTQLRVDAALVAQVLLGIVGTYTGWRQVCSHCRHPYQPDESSFAILKSQGIEVSPDDIWMRGIGCKECYTTGMTPSKKRIAEAIYIDRELAELCASPDQREALESALAERGVRTYFEQMLDYARQGDVTLEEAIRVGLARRADL